MSGRIPYVVSYLPEDRWSRDWYDRIASVGEGNVLASVATALRMLVGSDPDSNPGKYMAIFHNEVLREAERRAVRTADGSPVIGHTPEPWHTCAAMDARIVNANICVAEGNGFRVIARCGTVEDDDSRREDGPNAERIVSCVNGCAGIKNPPIEVPALREERDLLLEALAQGWSLSRISCYDEEGVEGWRWTDAGGKEYDELGSWDEPPPFPDEVRKAIEKLRGNYP